MDATIVSAAITAITSMATCLLGLHAGRKDAAAPSIVKIRERQVENLYAPLEIALNSHGKDLAQTLITIRSIIEQNYSIVPPAVLKIFQAIDASKPLISEDFYDFHKAVSSFYNWTRRSLGYPYDGSTIKRKLIPTYERNSIILGFLSLASILIWCLSVNMTLLLFVGHPPSNIPEWAYEIAIVISILGVPAVVSSIQKKKR